MKRLTELYDSLQERILTLIEEGRTDLKSQIEYWQLERKVQAVLFQAKKDGYRNLGLQPVPAAVASEVKGKQAIAMTILLDSLSKSPYANERWTLGDTGVELVLATEPKHSFKKHGYEVLVLYDHEMANSYPYTNWDAIYFQDSNEQWIKTSGHVDYNGLYLLEPDGSKAYYTLFAENAGRYGRTGEWTVQYRNNTIYPPVTSSRPSGGAEEEVLVITDSGSEGSEPGPAISPERETDLTSVKSTFQTQRSPGSPGSPREEAARVGGRRRQGESSPTTSIRRAKADSTGGRRRRPYSPRRGGGGRGRGAEFGVSAEEVGRSRRTVAETGLSRIERLQEEARDPPIILVQGHPNSLKCWRNRLYRFRHLYTDVTTVFKWVLNTTVDAQSRIIVAFKSTWQRQQFLAAVTIPKRCTYVYGSLNAL